MNPSWRQANRIGLVMTIALGLVNIAIVMANLPTLLHGYGAGQGGPPRGVLATLGVLGPIMIIGAVLAWTTGSRRSATIASVANILQALTTLPAFGHTPLLWQVIAGAIIAWTVMSVALTLSRSRGSAPVE